LIPAWVRYTSGYFRNSFFIDDTANDRPPKTK
jgi:hypothetical protein